MKCRERQKQSINSTSKTIRTITIFFDSPITPAFISFVKPISLQGFTDVTDQLKKSHLSIHPKETIFIRYKNMNFYDKSKNLKPTEI